MKIYWDSSALINALASRSVYDRLSSDAHFTRSHGLVEAFSHLTGRGLPLKNGSRQRVIPADAHKMLAALAKHFAFRDLSWAETLAVIQLAQERGVQGARIHDLLHARAAALSKAKKILTRDDSFDSLGEPIKAEWP
jgi:hypothetical protein